MSVKLVRIIFFILATLFLFVIPFYCHAQLKDTTKYEAKFVTTHGYITYEINHGTATVEGVRVFCTETDSKDKKNKIYTTTYFISTDKGFFLISDHFKFKAKK